MTLAREASLAPRKIAGVVPCAAEWSPIPPRPARLATKEEELESTRTTALFSGSLLLLLALTMTGALGIKAPLDASFFSAAGAALLLATCADYPFSIDRLRQDSVRGEDR